MREKTNGRARVSDHAVIRYLERTKGFDFEPVREHIRKAAQLVLDVGASSITIDGVSFVLNEFDLVVTTVDPRMAHHRGKHGNGPKTVIRPGG